MKIVTFKVAKFLKDHGFPQTGHGPVYKESGELENGFTDLGEGTIAAPTYFEAWNWLSKEKNLIFGVECTGRGFYRDTVRYKEVDNPEDAVISGVEYICDCEWLLE